MLIMTPLFQADAPGNYVECQCINCARMGICHGYTGRCVNLRLCVAAENVGTGRNGAAYAHCLLHGPGPLRREMGAAGVAHPEGADPCRIESLAEIASTEHLPILGSHADDGRYALLANRQRCG